MRPTPTHTASFLLPLVLALLLPAGCGPGGADARVRAGNGPERAIAVLRGTEGYEHTVRGVVRFEVDGDHVLVTAEVEGLNPGQKHGFHIHEYGDPTCEAGMCAGDHFNPFGRRHGGPGDEERHVGDLGNLQADEDGKAVYRLRDPLIKLHGPQSVVGRGVVVHADPDDLKSDPTGNAGARIAVGVIGLSKPPPGPEGR